MESSDVRLIVRAASGDRGALGELYDRHAPRLMAIGLRILRDRGEAEEILHDVFVEVWRKAGTYDPSRGTVKTWLSLRMRSRCLDRVKSARRSRTRSSAGDPEPPAPAVSLAPAEDGGRLRRALDALPEEQRAVLVLGYFEGLTSREMAARLGVPIGTVKSRVKAAMSKLRAALVEPGS